MQANLSDYIKKLRNPLFHPMESFKRIWKQRKNEIDQPSLTLKLKEYLHPSFMITSELLE